MTMIKYTNRWRDIIVQGWSGMLFLLFLMMLIDLIEFGMKGDFSALIKDPGVNGLWFIVIMTGINVIAQISMRTFDNKSFRWIMFGATAIYTLVFVGHQISHLIPGVFDFHFVIDIVHHILGVWASIAAYRWAMSPDKDSS